MGRYVDVTKLPIIGEKTLDLIRGELRSDEEIDFELKDSVSGMHYVVTFGSEDMMTRETRTRLRRERRKTRQKERYGL